MSQVSSGSTGYSGGMRWLLIACLCLGVAFQGLARAAAGAWHCSPDTAPVVSALGDTDAVDHAHDLCDCCSDGQASVAAGLSCTDPSGCGVIAWGVPALPRSMADTSVTAAPAAASEAWQSTVPAPAWRPPAA